MDEWRRNWLGKLVSLRRRLWIRRCAKAGKTYLDLSRPPWATVWRIDPGDYGDRVVWTYCLN